MGTWELEKANLALRERNRMLENALAEANRRADERDYYKRQCSLLRELATIDELTLVSNLRDFNAAMCEFENLFGRGEMSGVLVFVDLDRFKEINDKLTRAAGDEVLQQVAACMRHLVRPTDVVARIGGDEFAILLKNTTLDKAKVIIERLGQSIRAIKLKGVSQEKAAMFVEMTGRQTLVGVSFGFCEATMECYHKDMLLARAEADVAKYESRRI